MPCVRLIPSRSARTRSLRFRAALLGLALLLLPSGPGSSKGTKPPLDAWLKPGTLERAIEDDLRKSDAPARQWGRPITAAALQAELDRIAGDTRAPGVLREILDALHGDAFVAAEVLPAVPSDECALVAPPPLRQRPPRTVGAEFLIVGLECAHF